LYSMCNKAPQITAMTMQFFRNCNSIKE